MDAMDRVLDYINDRYESWFLLTLAVGLLVLLLRVLFTHGGI